MSMRVAASADQRQRCLTSAPNLKGQQLGAQNAEHVAASSSNRAAHNMVLVSIDDTCGRHGNCNDTISCAT
jgi:hypothetical protein